MIIALTAALSVWVWPGAIEWALLAGVGLSMLCAQLFFLTSLGGGDASYVIPFMYSTLIFASVLDFVVFGDAPDMIGALGAAIIVAGAIFLAFREETLKKQRKPH